MYTIKQASARTGLGAPLIRAWERRYGVIAPTRTASGYRLYDEQTIKVLLAMRALVDTGWTASEAARAIAAGEVAVDEVAVQRPVNGGPAPTTAAAHRARLIERFVVAAESTSPVETEGALDRLVLVVHPVVAGGDGTYGPGDLLVVTWDPATGTTGTPELLYDASAASDARAAMVSWR